MSSAHESRSTGMINTGSAKVLILLGWLIAKIFGSK
jgi:hypothetical protein